jgi:hypothetical protein
MRFESSDSRLPCEAELKTIKECRIRDAEAYASEKKMADDLKKPVARRSNEQLELF